MGITEQEPEMKRDDDRISLYLESLGTLIVRWIAKSIINFYVRAKLLLSIVGGVLTDRRVGSTCQYSEQVDRLPIIRKYTLVRPPSEDLNR